MSDWQDRCPYCSGSKRIRNDLVSSGWQMIMVIKNGNELWLTAYIHGKKRGEVHEYSTMNYISYCPMCGHDLNDSFMENAKRRLKELERENRENEKYKKRHTR